MTRYELIKASESILKMCDSVGIQPAEAAYLALYEDWVRLVGEGHKKVWILAYLSQKYKVSEATIKRTARKFSKRVKP